VIEPEVTAEREVIGGELLPKVNGQFLCLAICKLLKKLGDVPGLSVRLV
jgi:hypothetical protein